MIAKTRCSTTGENAFIIGSVYQESVMKRPVFAKEGKRVNHALIMLSAIRL